MLLWGRWIYVQFGFNRIEAGSYDVDGIANIFIVARNGAIITGTSRDIWGGGG